MSSPTSSSSTRRAVVFVNSQATELFSSDACSQTHRQARRWRPTSGRRRSTDFEVEFRRAVRSRLVPKCNTDGVVTLSQTERNLPTTANVDARDFSDLACWLIVQIGPISLNVTTPSRLLAVLLHSRSGRAWAIRGDRGQAVTDDATPEFDKKFLNRCCRPILIPRPKRMSPSAGTRTRGCDHHRHCRRGRRWPESRRPRENRVGPSRR